MTQLMRDHILNIDVVFALTVQGRAACSEPGRIFRVVREVEVAVVQDYIRFKNLPRFRVVPDLRHA